MIKDLVQKMFEAAVHIGHRTHKWDPRMKRYIYGERNDIHIINLEKTAEFLQRALNFLSKCAAEGKIIMFVSTKPQAVRLVEDAAKECRCPYVVAKWIPGLITNFSTIKNRIKYLTDLKEQEKNGNFDKYTKKEAAKLRKMIEKLQVALGGVENLTSKPDVVFVVDVLRDKIVVKEACRVGIPIVGIVDTNADPTSVDYPIPGNDDAIKSLTFFVDCVKDAVKGSSKTKR